jgi:Xaa-Pro aminopeptidase
MSVSFGIVGTDVMERINWVRLREEKKKKALKSMKEAGLGAILTMYEENIRYISSTHGPEWTKTIPGLRCGLLLGDGEVVVYEQGDTRYQTIRHNPWLKKENVRYAYTWTKGAAGPANENQAKKLINNVKKYMADHGVADLPLGVDFADINMFRVFKDLNVEWTDGLKPMLEARAVKTDGEVEALRIAATIADSAHYELTRILRPGIKENEVVADLMKYVFSVPGIEHVENLVVSSGPNAWPNWRTFTDRMIRYGDLVLIDIVIVWNGYFTCHYRTYRVGGQPTQEQKDAYQQAYNWLYDAIKVIKPGITTKDIASKWPTAKELWGYEEEDEAAANLWGHGLGLSHYDLPVVSRIFSLDYPYPIRTNMFLALETQQGKTFQWGTRVEEEVLVTDTGHEVVTKFPVEEITTVG